MRPFFITGCKLLGIFAIYWTFITIPKVSGGLWAAIDAARRGSTDAFLFYRYLFESIFLFLISLSFACLLIFRTDWLANRLSVIEKSDDEKYNYASLLKIGIILLGLYIFLINIPSVVVIIYELTKYTDYDFTNTSVYIGRVIYLFVTIVLSILIVLKSDTIVRLIHKEPNQSLQSDRANSSVGFSDLNAKGQSPTTDQPGR